MSFPTDEDIKRILDMQSSDCGFFVLAIYAFIEKYMKSEISFFGGDDDTDATFNSLVYKYIGAIKKRIGWLSEQDHNFLFQMRNGKQNSNLVRHQFKTLSIEEARAAIRDLLKFCEISDNVIREKFEPLSRSLLEWEERISPSETAKELFEANKKIAEMQKNLPNLIKESSEYLDLQTQLEDIKKRCEQYKNDINKSEQINNDLKHELDNYESKQIELQKRFGNYEEYISNLQRMLTYTRTRNDFEHTILRLTTEQKEAVNRIKFQKDYLIRGSAGTGKSFVLLKSVEKLIDETKGDEYQPSLIFVTFTTSLVKYNSYVAKLMNMGIVEENIKTADSFFKEILDFVIPKHYVNYSEQYILNYKKMITDIIQEFYPNQNLNTDDIYNEASTFIWPNMIEKEEYLDQMIDRTGLKTALKYEQRLKYWDVISKLEDKLNIEKTWLPEYAKLQVARNLKQLPLQEDDKFSDYIFIDEAQDLSICSMFCLKSVCRGSIIMAGDKDQTIYQIQTPLIRSGIDISGNSITLKTNFRNTIQINDVAEKYRKLIKGMNMDTNPSSFRMGPPVELIELDAEKNQSQDLFKLIAQRVRICIDELRYAPENICIILSDIKNQKPEKIINELKKLGIESEGIKNKDFSVGGKICVSTIQSCKGLDFPVVILLADHRVHFNDSKYDEETVERLQRNMFYVAMTRAMDMLTVITWNNSNNDVINDIKKCILEDK